MEGIKVICRGKVEDSHLGGGVYLLKQIQGSLDSFYNQWQTFLNLYLNYLSFQKDIVFIYMLMVLKVTN